MKAPPVVHRTFSIERVYPAPVARVFSAWADIETKAKWFIGPPERWTLIKREMDFRVGGQELVQGSFKDGGVVTFTARYHAILPNQQLVYVYDMHVGPQHLSASLATVEFEASEGGTRMRFTEQAAFFDGKDGGADREAGTLGHLVRIGTVLAREDDSPRLK